MLDRGSPTFDKNINVISPVFEEFIKRMLTKDHFKRIGWEEIFQYRITPEGIFKGGMELKDNINHGNMNRHSELTNKLP